MSNSQPQVDLRIVEGIAGTWHYHLSDYGQSLPLVSLCRNREMMPTQIPLSYWNKTPEGYHIPEKWCATCESIAKKKGWLP